MPDNSPQGVQAEERARFLGRVADSAPSILYVFDLETGRNLYANERISELLGFTPAEVRDMGEALLPALMHPEDWAATPRFRSELMGMADGEFQVREYRMHRKSGEYRWFQGRETVFARGPEGQPRQVLGSVVDITEARLAEEALRASEAKFAVAFGTSPVVLTISRVADGRFAEVNESFVRMSGYSRAEAIGKTPLELGLWQDEGQYRAGLESLASGESMRDVEARFRLKDGSTRTALLSASLLDIGGETHILSALTDITERKRAEERDRQQAALIDLSYEPIFAWHWRDGISEWNRGCEALYGYTKAEAIGKHAHSLLRTAYPEPPEEILRRLERTGFWSGELSHTTKDGRSVTVESRQQLLEVGGERLVLESNRDITKRKEAEKAGARLAAIVASSSDAILSKTLDGIITSWNASAERMFGYKAEEIVGQNILRLIPPERHAEEDQILSQLRAGRPVEPYETVRLAKGGNRLEVSLAISPVKDAGGEVIGASKIVRDITERKRFEAELAESEARFRAIAEALPGFVWVDSVGGTNEYMNARWTEYTGQSVEEARDGGWRRVTHPEDIPAVEAKWARSRVTGEPYEQELRHRRADGSYGWFLARGVPVRAESGEVLRWIGTSVDINERRLAEAALRESEERSRAILESISDAFFALDPAWKFTYVNREAERVLLRPKDELLGQSIWEQFPEALDSTFELEYRRAARERVPVSFVEFYPPLAKWFEVSAYPSEAVLSVYFRDITERRRAEEVLREQSAVLEAINLGSQTLIYLKDREGRIRMANPATLEAIGKGLGAVVGKTHAEYMDNPAEATLIAEHDRRIIEAGKTETFEEEVTMPDGTHTFLSTKTPYRDAAGSIIGLVGVSFDITERKRAEEALREAESHFRQLAETIPQLAWMAEPDGSIFWYNPRWYEYTGTTPEEMRGWGWQKVHHPQALPAVLERWRESLESGEPFDMTFPLRGADGQFRPFLTRIVPLKGEGGRVLRWFGTNTDISEQLQTEAALRESEERYRLLAEAQKRFVSDASHELRAPLTAIQGNLELVQRFKMSRADRDLAVGEAVREATRLGRLVADMLALARGDAGAAVRQERVDFSAVVGEALEEARHQAQNRRLEREIAPEVWLTGDRDRLKQLAIILLENAIKYTPQNGKIKVELGLRDSQLRLTVRDNGLGISAADLPHVFERFYRADQSRQRDPGGTGLGLSIAQWIVEAHGGRIWLESELGKGTVATAEVPVGQAKN